MIDVAPDLSADKTRCVARRTTRMFSMAFGGYDRSQVEDLFLRADRALRSGSEVQLARARQELRSPNLSRRLRGYRRRAVKRMLEERSYQLGSDV